MDAILGYDSSSSDNDDNDNVSVAEAIPDVSVVSALPLRTGNLGAGIKNTFNDSIRVPHVDIELKTTAKITDFVPTSLRQKKSKLKNKATKSGDSVQKLDLNVGDIFEANKQQQQQHTKIQRFNDIPQLPLALINYRMIDDPVQLPSIDMDVDEDQTSTNRKRRIIDESQIIDFNLNEFYDKNNELQSTGELNFEDHERQNKKIKYHNTTGTNQLSDLIKFSAKNTGKLELIHDKAKSIKSQTAQRYGFKK